jgi:opacity protein-like surface antigen
MRRIVLGLLALSACGPVDLDVAERQCVGQAQLAQHPRGEVGFGMDSQGNVGANLTLGISSDYVLGRDPDAVYAACVMDRSGQMPSRPYSSRPESRM